MTRLVCLGDLHLQKGETLHPGRLREQEQVLDRILTAARDTGADGVLLAGDLFDRRRPSPEALLAAERPLVRHRDQGGPPVIAIVGNHDVVDLTTGCGLDVLHEAGLLELHREPGLTTIGGVTVACLPWAPTSRLRAQLGGDLAADEVNVACAELLIRIARELRDEASGPCVLLAHWAVDQAVLPSGMSVADLREVVLPAGDLAGLGFDTVVLGHIHRGQLLDDDPTMLYTGPPLALDFGDTSDCGYWTLDLAEDVTPQPGLARFVSLDGPAFLTLTADTYEQHAVQGHYVRVRLAGDEPDMRDSIYANLMERGAAFVRFEVEQRRVDRGRIAALDDTVSDEAAFGMWLDAVEATDDERPWLLQLDQHYREQVAA